MELHAFPQVGIKLSFLISYILQLDDVCDKTAFEVDCDHIQPVTARSQCSFCEYQQLIDPTVVGEAKVHVIHAWNSRIVETLEALKEYFTNEADIFIWFDMCSVNHSKFRSEIWNGEAREERGFEWWSKTLMKSIEGCGHTVMVLGAWNNPTPLTRGWCVWQLYCTIVTGSRFGVAVSKDGEKQFLDDIKNSPTKVVNAMLASVNSQHSGCSVEADRKRIHEVIAMKVGFSKLDATIFEALGGWVLQKYKKYHERILNELGEDHPDTLQSANNLAELYFYQGKYEQAESLYVSCYEKRRSY